MKNKLLLVLLLCLTSTFGYSYQVKDIEVVGLQRISLGVVLNGITIEPNLPFNDSDIASSIKVLFAQGKYQDVRMKVDGDKLLIELIERPTIGAVTFEGNDKIPTEGLKQGLDQSGLVENEILRRSTVSEIETELLRQYALIGLYNASIESEIIAKAQNKVDLNIIIEEGPSVVTKNIEIVGNELFSDDKLLNLFDQKEDGINAFYQIFGKNKFDGEELTGDFKKLESFYYDQGYARFEILSSQVSVGDDESSIYVNVNVSEGDIYRFGNTKLTGEFVELESKLMPLLDIEESAIYNQTEIQQVIRKLNNVLFDEGYYYAQVVDIPTIDDEQNTVSVDFLIQPGVKTYIRRIEVEGNLATKDAVVRRELRQLEGSIASRSKLSLSERRLHGLGFFKSVRFTTKPVAGRKDLLDIVVRVDELSTGTFTGSMSYSPSAEKDSIEFSVEFAKDNFVGTGKNVATKIAWSKQQTALSLQYSDPYFTQTGGSRSLDFNYQQQNVDVSTLNIADEVTNIAGIDLTFGYPISEFERLSYGIGIGQTDTYARQASAEVQELFAEVGSENVVGETESGEVINSQLAHFYSLKAFGGWRYSNVNGGFLANDGRAHSLNFSANLPGSSLLFYKVAYSGEEYFRFFDKYSLRFHTKLKYGNRYDNNKGLPYFENHTTGGFSSVRGFAGNSIGPTNTPTALDGEYPRSILGGNISINYGAELLFPVPILKDKSSFRMSAFVDSGNVYTDYCHAQNPDCYEGIDFTKMRSSYGLSLTWNTPIAPLAFTLAKPIYIEDGDYFETFRFGINKAF